MNRSCTNLPALLLVPSALYGLYAPWGQLLPSHAFDKRWPDHARFHLIWAAAKLFAIGISQMLLIIFPFRSGQRWSWFALASNLLFGGAAIVPASRVIHGPIPPLHKHDLSTKVVAGVMVMGVMGLALGIGPMFLRRGSASGAGKSR